MILDFQICDDSLFILLKARGQLNLLTGWNWRRSKQIMVGWKCLVSVLTI
jgi:hypothetical protein